MTTVGSSTMELAKGSERRQSRDRRDDPGVYADPEHVNKEACREDEIRPCIRCTCTGDDPHGCPSPWRCAVNPEAAETRLCEIRNAEAPKKSESSARMRGIGTARRLATRASSRTV